MSKKIYKFLTSLKFGIILLLIIAAYSIIGTVLAQGLAAEYYIENYPSLAGLINFLQLGNVYKSAIFIFINFLFIVNLVGCTMNILPGQLHRMKENYKPSRMKDAENLYIEGMDLQVFKDELVKKRYKIQENEEGFIAFKNKIGNIGSAVTHLGIVIIVLGGFLGGLFDKEDFVNMLPGNIHTFEEKGFSIRLDDFYLDLREDGSVDQYYSEITIMEDHKEIKKEKMWVNKPFKYKGINFYQSSYGWASNAYFKDEDGELLHQCLLKNRDSCFYQPLHLNLFLYGYFPDLHVGHNGEPISLTEEENNPHYAVVLNQFDQSIGSLVLEPGQEFEYEGIKISLGDSKLYTGITYNVGFGYIFMLVGSFFLLMGLALSFYFYPKHILVEEGSIEVSVRQNQWGYSQTIKNYLKSIKKKEDK